MLDMSRKAYSIILMILLITTLFISVNAISNKEEVTDSNPIINTDDYISQNNPHWQIMKNRTQVKGIYMTANTVAGNTRFNKLIDLIENTELNAVVIDVKNDEGYITYSSTIEDVKFTGANDRIIIKDIDTVLKNLKQKNIYTIARIVSFKDKKAGNIFPNLAIKNTSGGIWRDRGGMTWLNPYNKESWEYIISIAEEAAIKGFDEIQFDYVRFPTDGNLKAIYYGKQADNKSKVQAISEFLAYARERLDKKGVVVSADVFGLVTTISGGMSIGQNLEMLSKSVDVICPMVYPSHYGKGSYGVAEPDFEPYKIVNHSMKIANDRIVNLEWDGRKAVLRPWLQDFTAKYLKKYKSYGKEEVKAQIKATYDAGVNEWILWNAGNYYTSTALNKN